MSSKSNSKIMVKVCDRNEKKVYIKRKKLWVLNCKFITKNYERKVNYKSKKLKHIKIIEIFFCKNRNKKYNHKK